MTRPQLPPHYEGSVEFLKWFVLTVTLGPLLLCAGCLGLGMLTAFLSRPDSAPPPHTAPAGPATGRP